MTDRIDPGFGHWLAGFVDGEGCFAICKNGNGTIFCILRITLHHHDEPILREIAERTGLGRVAVTFPPSQKSARASWCVSRKAECLDVVELFTRFPLRAKKRHDFEIWTRAVKAWASQIQFKGGNSAQQNDYELLYALRHELRASRPSRGPKVVIP